MKFYLDSANVQDIISANELQIINGVTTNPQILQNSNINEIELLNSLKNSEIKQIFFQLNGLMAEDRIKYFEKLSPYINHKLHMIKIPVDFEGIKTISYFKKNFPEFKILATTIYNTNQAIVAIQLGCEYLAPYYNRMFQEGINADEVLAEIRKYIDINNYNTKIIAASFKSVYQIKEALLNGAHTVTIPFDLLKSMVSSKACEKDVNNFAKII